jgi:hypothetical protein
MPPSLFNFPDFKGKVDQSRTEAVDELTNLPDIESEISSAERLTREAEQAVGDAKQVAEEAATLAEEANLKAKNLAEESTKLAEIAHQTEKSTQNTDSLDSLNIDIDALAATTKDFENQVESHKHLRLFLLSLISN